MAVLKHIGFEVIAGWDPTVALTEQTDKKDRSAPTAAVNFFQADTQCLTAFALLFGDPPAQVYL